MSISTVAGNGESENKIEHSGDSTQNRDEEIEGMSLVSLEATTEFTDPAILAAKPAVIRIRYTKEDLLRLRQAPQSLKRPECLALAYDIFQFDRKSSDTPSDNGGRFEPEYKRRSNDPRERVRKEQDGIVLSPQRRSFNSGCFVPLKMVEIHKRNRSDSPLGNKTDGGPVAGSVGGPPHHIQPHREIPAGARRIGSGRILTREVPWDYQDKGDADAEYGYRRERRDTDRDDSRYERRSFGRDNNDNKDKEKQHGRGRFGGDRRRIENREEEPEWFSGGPSSQHDTIELRGFDDDMKKSRKMKRSKERANLWKEKQHQVAETTNGDKSSEGGNGNAGGERNIGETALPNSNSTPKANEGGGGNNETEIAVQQVPSSKSPNTTTAKSEGTKTKELKEGGGAATGNVNGPAMDSLEAIFDLKNIPSILTNGMGGDVDASSSGSRFSRFFKTSSPPKTSRDDENENGGGGDGGSGRPTNASAAMHDDYLFKNILRDLAETMVAIPGDTESSFAPISPAAYTGGSRMGANAATTQNSGSNTWNLSNNNNNNGGGGDGGQKPPNLIDIILQRNRQNAQQEEAAGGGGVKNLGIPGGKVLSLEELEAKMLQQGGGDPGAARLAAASSQKQQQQQKLYNQQQQQQQQQSSHNKVIEDDMTAFKRLLAQVSGGHAVTATNGPMTNKQPMNLLEMLSHSQQQEFDRLAAQLGSLSPNLLQSTPPIIANDVFLKLSQEQKHAQQQRQQRFDMVNKLVNAGIHHGQPMRTNQLPDMSLNQSRELLGRPEAQAILQGLKRGDITPQHLYQQLANPAMQPRHRELLLTIIKLHGGGGGGATAVGGAGAALIPSPRVLSPVPPAHPLFAVAQQQKQQQQTQQLRVSPLPPNAMHQRIPSPRELQVHTQNIMQRALIKKKLEEQQENFKKRQEMQQRGQSPAGGVSPAKQTASPTPLAFTPTSVLRKMTAEKDEGNNKESGTKTDGQSKGQQQQGRPVIGMKTPLPQQQQQNQQQWNVQQQSLKQPGRAIVKANPNFQTSSQQQQQPPQDVQQFFQQQRLLNQQQQRLKMNNAGQQSSTGVPPLSSSISSSHHLHHHQQSQQQHNYNMLANHNPHHHTQMNATSHHHSHYLSNPQQQQPTPFQSQSNHLTHQQLRAQHQQQQQPTNQQQPQQQQHFNNNNRTSQQQQSTWGGQQQQQQQQQGLFGQFQNFDNTQIGRGGMNGGGGGDLSPTSNQLARWFSSDLLERARAGKLPNMPNSSHSQHAINLEELERQTAPPVHN